MWFRLLCFVLLLGPGLVFAQQRDCCWCQTSSVRFGVEVPAGFGSQQCPIACNASRGTYVGFKRGACYAPPQAPSAPACAQPTSGGDCKGNNWCQCNGMSVGVSNRNPKIGEKVNVTVSPGDLGSGKPQVDSGGGFVDWGDGQRSNFPKLQDGLYEHSYSKAGSYVIKTSATGQFKWNADDGSCSFYCTAQKNDGVTVGVNVLSKDDMVKLLEKQPSAKTAILLQKLKSKEPATGNAADKEKKKVP